LNARVERLVFAARDLRFGAVRSCFRLADSALVNHRVAIDEGLMAAEAAELLQTFFAERR
jgi:tRNA(adenine34) deaminase